MKEEKIFCKDCKYFYKKESSVYLEFIDGFEYDIHGIKLPSNEAVNDWGITMCHHPKCFEKKKIINVMYGYTIKKPRILGQAQLNKNCNCIYFKKKNVIHKIMNLIKYCTF